MQKSLTRRSRSLTYHQTTTSSTPCASTRSSSEYEDLPADRMIASHHLPSSSSFSLLLLLLLHSTQLQSIQSLDLTIPSSSSLFSILSIYSYLKQLDRRSLLPSILSSLSDPSNSSFTLSNLSQLISHHLAQLKLDLFSPDPIQSDLQPRPLHHLPLPSSDPLNLKHPIDRLIHYLNLLPDPKNQLVQLISSQSQRLDELLSQLSSLLSQIPSSHPLSSLTFPSPIIIFPESLSALIPPGSSSSSSASSSSSQRDLKTPSNLTSLRQYFSEESDRLASLLLPSLPSGLSESWAQSSNHITSALRACKQEAQAVLHDGEVFFREEGEKLKGWVDSETEKLRLALQMGASRLLTYHELPDEWKNNRFIVRGYRFIPLDRWHHLLLSGIQWHNETINIHTHFFGTLSLFYLLFFLWPKTPHTALDSSTLTDRVISLIFLVCAIKCLICSTAWHLFAGCGTLGPFKRLACVDYVGISGLIAASVMSMEYYGFYCRPGLAAIYMTFTVIMGGIGMILPFKPFFDRPESKGIRILFFVSMAGSALIPQAHMAYLYGLRQTFNFYYPAYYSVISYLAGLVFYATNWPERVKPGWVFDTLFHSHQFWHVAIVVAIWLHWRAIGMIHDRGRMDFSCSVANSTSGSFAIGGTYSIDPSYLDYLSSLSTDAFSTLKLGNDLLGSLLTRVVNFFSNRSLFSSQI